MMVISLIGSGNTATVLGRVLKLNGHTINEVAGRNKNAVEKLAEELNAVACMELNQLNTHSDIYIIAVRDEAVAEVSTQLNLHNKIVVHTAGSVAMKVLADTSENYGVLYPLQSLRKELNYNPVVPFLVDGNNDITNEFVFNIASSISKDVQTANDEARLQYHLSAIIVQNFSNHLYVLAKDYCNSNNIDFNLLLPLIKETVNRLHNYEPSLMQTGPAIRGDEETMQKHLSLLESFPQLKKIYEVMSESIKHHNKL